MPPTDRDASLAFMAVGWQTSVRSSTASPRSFTRALEASFPAPADLLLASAAANDADAETIATDARAQQSHTSVSGSCHSRCY